MANMIDNIVAGIAAGVTTSAIWAGIVYWYNWKRNRDIERSIRESLQPESVCTMADGTAGTEINNCTSIPVIVRSVDLIGGQENRKGTIQLGLNREHSPRGSTADDRGWVLLPAKTKATWSYPFRPQDNHLLRNIRPIREVRVVVEYTTLFGTTSIIEVGPSKNLDPAFFEMFLDGHHWEQMERNRAEGKSGLWQ